MLGGVKPSDTLLDKILNDAPASNPAESAKDRLARLKK